MPGSVTSVFSEPDDFEAALRQEGTLGLLVTGRGQFRARLTQITLHRLRLSNGEEQLSRIAVLAVPRDLVLISFPIGTSPSPIWNGVGFQAGEIMIIGPDQKVYARTDGPCRWGAIWLPVEDLIQDGRAVTGGPFTIPSVAQYWRPPPVARAHLGELYTAAVRVAETRPQLLADAERAHGLEQQLIHALIKALAAGSAARGTPTQSRYQDILGRFEDLLHDQPHRSLRMAEICDALGVSDRLLRTLCSEHLGMGPSAYIRLRRMSLVRRALGRNESDVASVSEIARRYGFHEGGGFAARYRLLFGEPPSATLAYGLRGRVGSLGRR